MKYYEVKFTITPFSSDASDLLAALAGEAGFETFDNDADGLMGYVQQTLFDRAALDGAIATFPMPGTKIAYTVGEADDRDWNEQWEQQGFEPINVRCQMEDGRCRTLIIHDGRHLPSDTNRQPSDINIEIDARQAFGTGTHETTRMVCRALLDSDLSGRRVLDCGCGTGILAIVAMKLGAAACVCYDIDEWSVDNTRHNAVINHVELSPLLGDAAILDKVEGLFDVVTANINRNILLADMPAFRRMMAPGARLILSGFYTADIPLLTAKAQELGLAVNATSEDNGWACLQMKLKNEKKQELKTSK